MVQEFRTSERFFRNICMDMPRVVKAFDQVVEHANGEYIVALTRLSTLLLIVLVCIPKLGISIILLLFGCRWLSATTSFENLVMNTVAMEFVTQIDETLFNACVPQDYRKQVQDINFFIRVASKEGDQDDAHKETQGFLRSVAYFTGAVLFIVLWTVFLNNVLPHNLSDIVQHCVDVNEDQRPLCNAFASRDHSCYPFGRPNTTLSSARPE